MKATFYFNRNRLELSSYSLKVYKRDKLVQTYRTKVPVASVKKVGSGAIEVYYDEAPDVKICVDLAAYRIFAKHRAAAWKRAAIKRTRKPVNKQVYLDDPSPMSKRYHGD